MITVAYITARPEPRLEWFFDSLLRCHRVEEVSQIIIVDHFAQECDGWTQADVTRTTNSVMRAAGRLAGITQHVPPKPNVWSGKYRLTPRNWWSKPEFINTALCLCKNDFIAYLDDRCVLMPTWLDAVVEAKEKNYVVCGTYEKRSGMVVSNGRITTAGELTGSDSRMTGETDMFRRRKCSGEWMFGCTYALPVEWMLQVNGCDESWSSVGMEDTHFGRMLENNGFPIYHDARMKMIEDRTPQEKDPTSRTHDMKRDSKEKHPHDKNDKTHTLIRKLWNKKGAENLWNLGVVRQNVLAGGSFVIPRHPTHDWFDNQPLKEMA